jgi:SAM-dependent methyltransferase
VADTDPALFYTGLVADLYAPLRSSSNDADIYAGFVERCGEPALELGCGDGDPILALRQRGLDVDGIDASPDMIDRCRARAAALGVTVDVSVQQMQHLALPRRYRSIYIAGPTFNVLPDDHAGLASLIRIRQHLADDGTALVPLFIPDATPEHALGKWKTATDDEGRTIRFTTLSQSRYESARIHSTRLRYERDTDGEVESVERDFVIHWYTQDQFRDLAGRAGLTVTRVLDLDASSFAFFLRPPALGR